MINVVGIYHLVEAKDIIRKNFVTLYARSMVKIMKKAKML